MDGRRRKVALGLDRLEDDKGNDRQKAEEEHRGHQQTHEHLEKESRGPLSAHRLVELGLKAKK